MRLLYYLKFIRWFHAAPCISRLHLKGFHAAPIVFEICTVAPCGSFNLKGFHAAPVAFKVYTVFPCLSYKSDKRIGEM